MDSLDSSISKLLPPCTLSRAHAAARTGVVKGFESVLGMIWGFSRLFGKGASGRKRDATISKVKRRELRRGMGVPPMNSWARLSSAMESFLDTVNSPQNRDL